MSKDSQIVLTETFTLDAATRERFGMHITPSGFLVAEPRVARIGIQIYKGHEVGRPDMDEVRVYRPETEVFDKRAMVSLAHKPITLDHPDTQVDATNWKEFAVGNSTGDVARDGEYIRVPLALMDAAAIKAARSHKSQLSVGYSANLKWEPGETNDGQFYDAVQTEIRANHIALVSNARGGNKLKMGDDLFDDQQRRTKMPDHVVNVDGVNIALDDKDRQILERHLSSLTTKLKDAEVTVTSALAKMADLQKAIETKDGEIIGLTKKLADAEWTPAKVDEAVRNRLELFERARRALGDKLVTDGKTDAEIKRQVVVAEIGDEEAKTMSDEAIAGVFRAVTREIKTNDGLRRTATALSQPLPTMNPSQIAHQKYVERLANAHKQKTA
jgi:hypothetical protein